MDNAKVMISVSLLLIFLSSFLQISSFSYGTDPSVIYIYATDVASAESYKSFLTSRGITVDLVSNSSAATWDYSRYGLVIIGSDTGRDYNWEPKAAVSLIDESGKPILGIGFGGSSFFEELNLSISYGQGATGSENSIYVADPTHRIFNSPTTINIPANGILQLYSSTQLITIYTPSLSPYGIIPLGRGVLRPEYSHIIQEGARYILWGFTNPPEYMTQTGKDLFINIVQYCLQGAISEGGIQIGVKTGDYVEYEYFIEGSTATPTDPYMIIRVIDVDRTKVTIQHTRFVNTTKTADFARADPASSNWVFSFVIPANLKVGDTIVTGYGVCPNHNGTAVILSETSRSYAGSTRSVLKVCYSILGFDYIVYYDKLTGIFVEEYKTSAAWPPQTIRAVRTNMWTAETNTWGSFLGKDLWFYAVILIFTVCVMSIAIFIVKRRRRKRNVQRSYTYEFKIS